MIRNLILLLAACYALKSYAQLDYNLKGTYRSYPSGIAANSDIGYGKKIWGEDSKVMYGYLRTGVNIQTSALVNYVGAQFDFYPVSFLGLSYGKTYGKKSYDDFSGFDCSELTCKHSVEKDTLSVNLALAYKKFKFIYNYKKQDFKNKTGNSFFAEEFSNLIGYKDAKLVTHTTVYGFDLSRNFMIGLLGVYNKMTNPSSIDAISSVDVGTGDSLMAMLIGSYKKKKITYQVGLGAFENRKNNQNFAALFIVNWNGSLGVKLF